MQGGTTPLIGSKSPVNCGIPGVSHNPTGSMTSAEPWHSQRQNGAPTERLVSLRKKVGGTGLLAVRVSPCSPRPTLVCLGLRKKTGQQLLSVEGYATMPVPSLNIGTDYRGRFLDNAPFPRSLFRTKLVNRPAYLCPGREGELLPFDT